MMIPAIVVLFVGVTLLPVALIWATFHVLDAVLRMDREQDEQEDQPMSHQQERTT